MDKRILFYFIYYKKKKIKFPRYFRIKDLLGKIQLFYFKFYLKELLLVQNFPIIIGFLRFLSSQYLLNK
jgi:hypothetical protein